MAVAKSVFFVINKTFYSSTSHHLQLSSNFFRTLMNFRRIILITAISIFFNLHLTLQASKKKTPEDEVTKINEFYCNFTERALEKVFYPNFTCNTTIWNRRTKTASFYILFRKPWTKSYVNYLKVSKTGF